jgi:hypothetical protein
MHVCNTNIHTHIHTYIYIYTYTYTYTHHEKGKDGAAVPILCGRAQGRHALGVGELGVGVSLNEKRDGCVVSVL